MVKVEAALDEQKRKLSFAGGTTYTGRMQARLQEKTKEKNVTKQLKVTAIGDNGESTTESKELYIHQEFDFKPILAKATGEELTPLRASIDIDLADTMDFEFEVPLAEAEKYQYGQRFFIPKTEFGGLLEDMEVRTKDKVQIWRGRTWRGLLTQKVIEPPPGEDHLTMSGDLNTILRNLIENRFGDLMRVSDEITGISITNWKVDRYATLYEAVIKMLQSKGYRLQIEYIQPDGLEYGYVQLSAQPIRDWSEEIEYSQDGKIHFIIRDSRTGINHLICVGKGENQERIVLHLYVQKDGTIEKKPFFTGLTERAAVYEYSNADIYELEKGGIERLTDLKNYKKMSVEVTDMDLELGDIVGGYEIVTGTTIKKPIINKILRIDNKTASIEYRVEGDE